MIIKGGSRSNWRFFAKHLMNELDNERVSIIEIRGLASDNIKGALQEMDALASGTKCKNHFYHAAINPRVNEPMTSEQWEKAIDVLESELGLEGHSRFVVEHVKDGREHRHVIWSRIDVDSMTAVSDSNNYLKHELAAQKLTVEFNHAPVPANLSRETNEKRPDRQLDDWEVFRGKKSKIDPKEVKAEVTALFQEAADGVEFQQALEEHGYVLCKGDRRDFCIIDSAGNEHSLARRIDGVKAAGLREFMQGVDRESLPSVSAGRDMIREARKQEVQNNENIDQNIDADIEPPAVEVQAEATREIGEETSIEQPSAVELATLPFEQRLEEQGHLFLDFGNDGMERAGWLERLGKYVNRISERVDVWYQKTKDRASSWYQRLSGNENREIQLDRQKSWVDLSRNRDDNGLER